MKQRGKAREPHCGTVACAGTNIPYTLVWSAARRRTIGYRVEPEGVVLRAPLRISVAMVEDLIREKAAWILRHFKELAARPKEQSWGQGSSVSLFGETFTLEIEVVPGLKRASLTRGEGGLLYLKLAEAAPATVEKALRRWVEAEGKPVLLRRVAEISATMQLRYGQVSLSHAKRRWGSCSYRNDLRFSWRLLMAPLPLVDYVIVHELAHVVHKNHGQRFWRLVEKFDPEYQQKRRALHMFGRHMA